MDDARHLTKILILLFAGACTRAEEVSKTYPANFELLSYQNHSLLVVAIEGFESDPRGVLPPYKGHDWPQVGCKLIRFKTFPDKVRIYWRDIKPGQTSYSFLIEEGDYSQEVQIPDVPKGALGTVRFTLHKDNVWTVDYFEDDR